MQQERMSKRAAPLILATLLSCLISVIFYILLGSFYNADNYTILINLSIWFATILVAYIVSILIVKFFYFLFKKELPFKKLLSFIPIAFSYLTILLLCIAQIKNIEDSQFVIIGLSIIGFPTIIEFIINCVKHYKSVSKRNN